MVLAQVYGSESRASAAFAFVEAVRASTSLSRPHVAQGLKARCWSYNGRCHEGTCKEEMSVLAAPT